MTTSNTTSEVKSNRKPQRRQPAQRPAFPIPTWNQLQASSASEAHRDPSDFMLKITAEEKLADRIALRKVRAKLDLPVGEGIDEPWAPKSKPKPTPKPKPAKATKPKRKRKRKAKAGPKVEVEQFGFAS